MIKLCNKKNYPSEHKSYHEAKGRCNNKNNKNYKNYGGRGIQFKFDSFKQFMSSLGSKPKTEGIKFSLDRINNNGNYESTNCRWATSKQQARNKRSNTLLTVDGKTETLVYWCEKYNITHSQYNRRHKRYGWSSEKALKEPIREAGRVNKLNEKYIYYCFQKSLYCFEKKSKAKRISIYCKTLAEAKQIRNKHVKRIS